jgi:16S rRNA G966 N2-methylase RsmD
MLIFYVRAARRKARAVARREALSLLRDLDVVASSGGPLSEQGGVFWISVPVAALETVIARLHRLGYTCAVDLLETEQGDSESALRAQKAQVQLVSWQRKLYRLVRVYEEDAQLMREGAPDRRTFLLRTNEGEVRSIQGYRGDGQPLSRRGLPVYDARMLVNLVAAGEGTLLLDPFAGTGGIVIEALASGCRVTSADFDPALQEGLSHLGAKHYVADASCLPFADGIFDAIATEPPYHEQAKSTVIGALHEMGRVLKEGGRLAILCAATQADDLRQEATCLGLKSYLDAPINRKGLEVAVLAWQKEA